MKKIIVCVILLILAAKGGMAQPNFNETYMEGWSYGLYYSARVDFSKPPLSGCRWLYQTTGVFINDVQVKGNPVCLNALTNVFLYNYEAELNPECNGAGHEHEFSFDYLFDPNRDALGKYTIFNATGAVIASVPSKGNYIKIGITPPRPDKLQLMYQADCAPNAQSFDYLVPDAKYSLTAVIDNAPSCKVVYYYRTDVDKTWKAVSDVNFSLSKSQLGTAKEVVVRAYGYKENGDPEIQYSAGYAERSFTILNIPLVTIKETARDCNRNISIYTISASGFSTQCNAIRVQKDCKESLFDLLETASSRTLEVAAGTEQELKLLYCGKNSSGEAAIVFVTDNSTEKAFSKPTAPTITTVDLHCQSNSGSIEVSPAPTSPWSYAVASSASPSSPLALIDQTTNKCSIAAPGSYTITAKYSDVDPNLQCPYTIGTATISDYRYSSFSPNAEGIKCFNQNDGKVSVVLTRSSSTPADFFDHYSVGVGGSTLTNSGSTGTSSTYNFEGKAPADYSLTLTYKKNNTNVSCKLNSSSINVPGKEQLVLKVAKVDPACSSNAQTDLVKGSITATASGGTAPYSIVVTKDGKPYAKASGTSYTFTDLMPGIYSVSLRDGNNCITPEEPISLPNPMPTLTVNSVTGCPGQAPYTVTLEGKGSYGNSYQYAYNSATFSSISTYSLAGEKGGYTFRVKDTQSGCIAEAQRSLLPLLPEIAIDSIDLQANHACYNDIGTVRFTVATPKPSAADDAVMIACAESSEAPSASLSWAECSEPTLNSWVSNAEKGLQVQRGKRYTFYVKVAKADNSVCLYKSSCVQILNPQPVSFTHVATDERYCQGLGGSISVTNVAHVRGDVTYTLDGIVKVTKPPYSVVPGDHRIQLTDAKGCSSAEHSVTVNPAPAIPAITFDAQPACAGKANGRIGFTWANGPAAYSLSWNGTDKGPGEAFDGRPMGTYTFQVNIGKETCTNPASFTLGEYPALAQAITPKAPSCSSVADGGITSTVSGGSLASNVGSIIIWNLYRRENQTTPFQQKQGTEKTVSFTNLPVGIYDLVVSDSKSCSHTLPFNLTPNPNSVTLTNLTPTQPVCAGQSNGSIRVEGGMGVGDWKLRIVDGANKAVASDDIPRSAKKVDKTYEGFASGTYTVFLTDGASCSDSKAVVVDEKKAITFSTKSIRNVTTASSSDGFVEYEVAGGNGGYAVTLLDPPAGALVRDGRYSNLPAGTYTVQIRDARGCEKEATFAIAAPPKPLAIVIAGSTMPKCSGEGNGAVTLAASGGWEGGYRFSKDGSSWQTEAVFDKLSAGPNTFWVMDLLGATKSITFTLGQPKPISVASNSTAVKCFGENTGSFTLTPAGGTEKFRLKLDSEADPTDKLFRDGLKAGSYGYTVTDGNGCNYTGTVTVGQPSAALALFPELSKYNGYSIKCSGGTDNIWVTATGGTKDTKGYTYTLGANESPSATNVFTSKGAGDYTITVKDANGCTDTKTVTLAAPPAIAWGAITPSNPTCNGVASGTITLASSGGIQSAALAHSYSYQKAGDALWISSPGQAIGGLAAGTYNVKVSDANGCSLESSGIKLEEPTAIRVKELQVTQARCKGQHGSLFLALEGGATPYRVTVDQKDYKPAPSITIPLAAGTYTALITNERGCKLNGNDNSPATISVTVAEPSVALSAERAIEHVKCFGQKTGSVSLSGQNGWGPDYTYQKLDKASGKYTNFSGREEGMPAGSYEYKVIDKGGCALPVPVTVDQLSPITVAVAVEAASCFGVPDGKISVVNAAGGGGGYTYQLNDGLAAASSSFSGLAAAEHRIIVFDKYGCKQEAKASVQQPMPISSRLLERVDPPCGTKTGKLYAEAAGGSKSYTMTWKSSGSAIAAGPLAENLPSGNYDLTVVDTKGCDATFRYTLVNPDAPKLESVTHTDLGCYGDESGKVEFLVNGVNHPVVVSLYDEVGRINSLRFENKQTSSFSSLKAGHYSLQMVDSHRCISGDTVTISQPAQVAMLLEPKDVACHSSSTGSIVATVKNGIAPYELVWSTGRKVQIAATDTLAGLPAGSYTASILDGHGCGDRRAPLTKEGTVSSPTTPLALDLSQVSQPRCANDATGWMTLRATGGWGGYTYEANSEANSSGSFNELASASYTVKVGDSKGCFVSKAVEIPRTLPLTLKAVDVKNLTCNGNRSGSVFLTTENGNGPFTYRLNQGSWASSGSFFNLSAGVDTFHVADKYGCASQLVVTLAEPKPLGLAFTAFPDTCGRRVGQLRPIPDGGTSPWTFYHNGKAFENTLKNLGQGVDTVRVVDHNGCEGFGVASVGEAPGPKITAVDPFPVSCAEKADGGAILTTLGGNGAVSVTWPDNSLTGASVTGLPKGKARAIATDAHQCSDTVTVTIPGPDPLTAATSSVVNPVCYGYSNGSVAVTPAGGTAPYSVSWSSGTTGIRAEQLASGSHTASVTDAHGCQSSATAVLADPDPIKPAIPASATLCSNQAIEVDAGYPGSDYAWTSTSGFTSTLRAVTLSDPGTYTVRVTDIKGCSGTASISLTKLAQDIDADFVVATSTAVGDTIVLVEFTLPLPDSISWDYPGAAFTLIRREANELHIRAEQEGTFPVALTTHMGLCSERFEKAIAVGPAAPKGRDAEYHPSLFKEVKLYPNPSDGRFTVEVTLNNAAPLEVGLYSTQQQRVFLANYGAAGYFSISSERLKLSPGFYLLTLKANGEMKTVKLIIQK